MFLTTWALLTAAALTILVGLVRGDNELVGIGFAALIIAAFLRRMIGRFRLRRSEKGIELEGTIIPEPSEQEED